MARHFFASANKGILSTEEETIPAEAEDTGSEEALATVMAEGEAAEAEADAAVDEANVADGLDGVVALENMRLTLRAANENGGMDRFGAMMAKQHGDFILQTFLKSPIGMTMPSNESFGGAGSRVGAGVLTMEGIKDKAKEIWAAIVKFLKKMKDKVMGWINKLFGAAEKLGQRADAIKKRADAAKGTAKEKTLDSDALFASLAVKDAITGDALKTGLGNIVKIADEMIENSVTGNKAITDVLDKLDKIDPKDDTAAMTTLNESHALMSAATKAVKATVADGEELPGNVTFRHQKETGAGTAAVRTEGFGLPSNGAKAKTGAKLPTLDLAAIADVCVMVKSISASLVATRKVEPESTKAYKKLDAFATKQSSESDVADSGDTVKSSHTSLLKTFKELSGAVDGPIKSLAGYCLKTARSSLDYCDASLGQY